MASSALGEGATEESLCALLQRGLRKVMLPGFDASRSDDDGLGRPTREDSRRYVTPCTVYFDGGDGRVEIESRAGSRWLQLGNGREIEVKSPNAWYAFWCNGSLMNSSMARFSASACLPSNSS